MTDKRFNDNPKLAQLVGTEVIPAQAMDGGADNVGGTVAPENDVGIPVEQLRATRFTTQSANYTLVLADANSIIHHPASDTTARIWTIPANSAVPFSDGTMVTFDNAAGAGALTIAITSDTLEAVGSGATGSYTVASGARATAVKVGSTKWRIG